MSQHLKTKILLFIIIGGPILLSMIMFAWGWVELTYEYRVEQLNKILDNVQNEKNHSKTNDTDA
jgi:hypothetical protein